VGEVAPLQYKSISIKYARKQSRARVRVMKKMNSIDVKRKEVVILSRR